jgi:small subunit ribosomal protein S8
MSMLSTDPIADMLTRIRNAINVSKREVRLPHSSMKERVARELVSAGFLAGVEVREAKPQSELIITINREGDNPVITKIERVSKPGRRFYAKAGELPKVLNGRGVLIVSTSKGVMTGQRATRERLGGELICKVY